MKGDGGLRLKHARGEEEGFLEYQGKLKAKGGYVVHSWLRERVIARIIKHHSHILSWRSEKAYVKRVIFKRPM